MKTTLVLLVALAAAGCGKLSPEQDAGELWLYERGQAKCVDVDHVSFYASHWTVYTLTDGTTHEVPGPFEYYAGKRCGAKRS